MPHPENDDVLVATTDGALLFRGAVIDIESVYTVSGDIDFNTGNIDCVGSLVIKGDVKSGFKIKAGGDVDIAGVVEDAEIDAEGQVILQKGVVGRGSGVVKAGGNVYLNYCENQKIYSRADVFVGEALLHSYVVAEGQIIVKGKKGAIIGGDVFATRGLEVKNLGNYQHVKTNVTVGVNEKTQRKFEEMEGNIAHGEENQENIKKAIRALTSQKATGALSSEKAALLEKLQNAINAIENQINELSIEKERLEKEFEKYKSATVKVFQKIYPGVHIRMQRDAVSVNNERSNVCYYLDKYEIVAKPNN